MYENFYFLVKSVIHKMSEVTTNMKEISDFACDFLVTRIGHHKIVPSGNFTS